jgi:Family of unknown function (DUF6880)
VWRAVRIEDGTHLKRGGSNRYGYAARDARHAASLSVRVADDGGIAGHDALVARLQREHGRKYSSWQMLGEERGTTPCCAGTRSIRR